MSPTGEVERTGFFFLEKRAIKHKKRREGEPSERTVREKVIKNKVPVAK